MSRSNYMLMSNVCSSAHVGFQTAQDSSVRVLTESAELFLVQLTQRLRRELDRDLETGGGGGGWGDILEKVRSPLN